MAVVRALRIERTIRQLAEERAPNSICPSEVARALEADAWRPLMPRVREAAAKMAERGEVTVTQRGKVVDITTVKGPIRITSARSKISYADAYRGIDFRAHPELYRVGKGEQGVLMAEPYKSELLPLWRFRTEEVARTSAAALWKAFVGYRKQRDIVGMDMARKFIQMGFTRARRYARHRTGQKYDGETGLELPEAVDEEKEAAASVFKECWDRVNADPTYRKLLAAFSSGLNRPSSPPRRGARTSRGSERPT